MHVLQFAKEGGVKWNSMTKEVNSTVSSLSRSIFDVSECIVAHGYITCVVDLDQEKPYFDKAAELKAEHENGDSDVSS